MSVTTNKIYPGASYPAEISMNARIDATNVLGGLQGRGRFDKPNSLLGLELVDKIERDGETYYRLSERGKSFIESIEPPITSYHENDKKKNGREKTEMKLFEDRGSRMSGHTNIVDEKLSISLTVMNKPVEDEGIFFELEEQNKTSDVNTLIIAHTSPEIFKMMNNGSFVTTNDLLNLFSDCESEWFVLMGEFVQPAFQFWRDGKFECHYSPINLSSSSIVIGFLPDLMVASTDLTTSSHRDSLTSLSSSSAISDISATFLFNSSSSISSNLSEIAFVATEDPLTPSILDIFSFNFPGILTTNSAISITSKNNVYPSEYKKVFRNRFFVSKRIGLESKNAPKEAFCSLLFQTVLPQLHVVTMLNEQTNQK